MAKQLWKREDMNPGLPILKTSLSMAPAPKGASAHVSAAFHVYAYASHSICHCKLHLKGPSSIFWLAPKKQGRGVWDQEPQGGKRNLPLTDSFRVEGSTDLTSSNNLPGPQGRRQGTPVEGGPPRLLLGHGCPHWASTLALPWGWRWGNRAG